MGKRGHVTFNRKQGSASGGLMVVLAVRSNPSLGDGRVDVTATLNVRTRFEINESVLADLQHEMVLFVRQIFMKAVPWPLADTGDDAIIYRVHGRTITHIPFTPTKDENDE